ncbi:MAG: glycosyltransferase [Verrucomicrobiia bacterium]
MQRPLVSVVIPVRNYERYIGASIESVLSQGFKDWELIVVDDASTDGTGKIADRYAEGERIRVVHNERNLGQFPTHNHGAKLARGKYLKFFHGDDIMYPHCLEMMVSLMEAFPDAGLGISYNPWPWVAPHLFSPLEAWRAHVAGQTGMFSEGPSGTIFRADAFRRAGGFDGRFRSGDCEMNLRMAMFFGVLLLPGGLWWYRSHDKQVVKQMTPDNTLPETLIWYRELLSHPVNPFSKDQKDQIDQQLVRETCQLILNRLRRGRIRTAWSVWKECGLSLGEMGAVFSRRRVFPPIPVEARATWSVFSSKPSAVSSPHASPLVSVLIPAFNAEAHLAEAIESVLAQRFADWELVIVDDASADRTREIAQSYVDGNRIRYFRNERNLGKWPNHNHCAELARGKHLKFLHADDLLYPHCLQTLFEHATSDAGGSTLVLSAPSPLPAGTRLDYGDALRHECFLSPIMVHSPSAFLMDAGVFRTLGGFQPRVAFCERHLQIRAAQQGPVVLANEGLVFFRRLHRWGIKQDEKYPMGLCEGMTWFEQLLLDPTCPLTESEKQYVVFRLRYGVARRAWKLFCTGRIAVLTDSLRAHSIRLKDLLCGLKTIPAEHGAVGANLIQSKTTTVAD